ncbi:MAG: OmpA family protein [Deltaproteobacteria bacterium]|jgi:outer membrane protein OmpA-like peptidoglycan-associated protein
MNRLMMLLLGIFLFQALPQNARAEDQATVWYKEAIRPGTTATEKIRLLEKSVSARPQFANFFELGKAYADADIPPKAEAAFDSAEIHADPSEKIRLFRIRARYHQKWQQPDEAAQWFKTALTLARREKQSDVVAAIEKELLPLEEKNGVGVVSTGRLVDGLQKGLARTKALAVLEVVPDIDIRVNFEYDSANLTAYGQRQAEELALALSAPEFSSLTFRLVGHTDLRGSAEYNQELSKRRAQAVATYILQHSGMASGRIEVIGKGKTAPLC